MDRHMVYWRFEGMVPCKAHQFHLTLNRAGATWFLEEASPAFFNIRQGNYTANPGSVICKGDGSTVMILNNLDLATIEFGDTGRGAASESALTIEWQFGGGDTNSSNKT